MTIPYARQSISPEDIKAVAEALQSDWLTQGPSVEIFEQAVAHYCQATHTLATCNATAALHLACLALDLGPGDILWTSPNTFIASANCGLYCGAAVNFVDIDPRTGNLDPQDLKKRLVKAEKEGKLPKIVIPVHFAGQPCDMAPISKLAKEYGFKIIEDASHAFGARYKGALVGSCTYSDIAVFSFHPVKIITTGEGGLLATRDPSLHEKMKRLRSHGMTRDQEMMDKESEGAWYYQQIELGYNFRMTDFQAILGASQLERISTFLQRRQDIASRYDEALKDLPLTSLKLIPEVYSAYHLYVIRLSLKDLKKNRRQVFDAMRLAGILVNVHYIPVHLQPYYRRFGFQRGDFPEAESHYQEALSLPMYYELSEADQEKVITVLKKALSD